MSVCKLTPDENPRQLGNSGINLEHCRDMQKCCVGFVEDIFYIELKNRVGCN